MHVKMIQAREEMRGKMIQARERDQVKMIQAMNGKNRDGVQNDPSYMGARDSK